MTKPIAGLVILACLLASCSPSAEIDILDAMYKNDGEQIDISAKVKTSDLQAIIDNEIYALLVLKECETEENIINIDTYLDGHLLDSFPSLPRGEEVILYGNVSKDRFDEIENPCVSLNGGSYLGKKISSNNVRVLTAW